MTREMVLEKVQKLLSLAGNNSNDNEAQLAALKAQELMAKHNISIGEVDTAIEAQQDEITEAVTGLGKWVRPWANLLANIMAQHFKCNVFFRGKAAVFYGYSTDAEIAKQTFEYIYKYLERAAQREYRRVKNANGYADNVYTDYVNGFIHGFNAKLQSQSTALMVIVPPEVKDAYKERSKNFGKSKGYQPQNLTASEHYRKGRADGNAFGTAKQLSNK